MQYCRQMGHASAGAYRHTHTPTYFETHPAGEVPRDRDSSCAQPMREPQALPANQTASAVKRARGTIRPLATVASTTEGMAMPARLLGLQAPKVFKVIVQMQGHCTAISMHIQ